MILPVSKRFLSFQVFVITFDFAISSVADFVIMPVVRTLLAGRNPMDLVLKLKTQIIEALQLEGVSVDDIDAEAPLFLEGLGLDSIDALELVVMLEHHYGIKIDDMAIGKRAFQSVASLAQFVASKATP